MSARQGVSVREAADAFLDTITVPNTHRAYATAIDVAAALVGPDRPLGTISEEEIADALETAWGDAAASTWNARRAAVGAWLTWARRAGHLAPAIPAATGRMPIPPSDTPIRSRAAIDRLTSRRDVPLREKTLWRMLYETAARANEILDLNVEDLDLSNRSALVRGKGAPPRRRGAAHAARGEHLLERVHWASGTARLLPHLLKGRTTGPVFATHRRPGPGRALGPRDRTDDGYARLSYDSARHLLDYYTRTGDRPGWDLHELRHSALTHLAEAGTDLTVLMAKSRHRKPETLTRYIRPSAPALGAITEQLAPR